MAENLSQVQRRVLLELSGRDGKVTFQELCQALDLDPIETRYDFSVLYNSHAISQTRTRDERVYSPSQPIENPFVEITWAGREHIARQLERERAQRERRVVLAASRARYHEWYEWAAFAMAVVAVIGMAIVSAVTTR